MTLATIIRAAIGAVLAVSLAAATSWSDDDHERAREALRRGEILSLSEILKTLGDELGGDVIEVEFEREDGLFVYEFKIVTPDGRVEEVYVDAATAEIVAREDD